MSHHFKGLCFAGREHHVKKLKSTIEYIEQKGFDIVYITANNVLNWDNFESPLLKEKTNYFHLFDFLDAKAVFEINKENENIQRILEPGASDGDGFSEYVSDFFVRFSIRDMVQTHILFKMALERLTPDVVFILHECNFWTKCLAHCAHGLKIPVISFQEGQYGPSLAPPELSPLRLLTEFSERVFLWGPKEFELLNTSEAVAKKLCIVGAPHLDEYINMSPETKECLRAQIIQKHGLFSVSKLIVFAVPHSRVAAGNIFEILNNLLAFFSSKPELGLIIRFHPFEADLSKSLGHFWAPLQNVCCDQDTEAPDLISAIDLCLCQRTSFGLECLALGKPVVEINYEHSNSDIVGFANQGIAHLISAPSQVPQIIDYLETANHPDKILKTRRVLEENFYSLDGRSRERVFARLLEVLSSQ